MKFVLTCLCVCHMLLIAACDYRTVSRSQEQEGSAIDIYSHTVDSLNGTSVNLGEFQGQVLLIVNLASQCGYTSQYRDLQALQEDYAGKPFTVIGFPSNDFGGQEPGGPETIQACAAGYGADFPIMAKVEVKAGEAQSPVYADLESALGVSPTWNFGKYLVDAQGKPAAFFGSSINPNSDEVRAEVDALIVSKKAGGS